MVEEGHLSLPIQNTLGKIVAILVQDQAQGTGKYDANFDTSTLPARIYFYTLSTSSFKETKKVGGDNVKTKCFQHDKLEILHRMTKSKQTTNPKVFSLGFVVLRSIHQLNLRFYQIV